MIRIHSSHRFDCGSLAIGLLVAITVLGAAVPPSRAEVFHSKESALKLAFPGADRVESRELFLSDAQVARIEEEARVKLPSSLVALYVGWKGNQLLGHAFFETHRVRSLPETLLIVVDAAGRSTAVHMLAFHEPKEYQPSQRWLSQFEGRELNDALALNHQIVGIAGSTLTATVVTAAVRRTLAVFRVGVGVTLAEAGETSPTVKTK